MVLDADFRIISDDERNERLQCPMDTPIANFLEMICKMLYIPLDRRSEIEISNTLRRGGKYEIVPVSLNVPTVADLGVDKRTRLCVMNCSKLSDKRVYNACYYTDRLLKQRVVLLSNVYTQVMKVLLKLCQNIVRNPGNPKFRNLNSKKMDRITGKVGTFSQILRSLDFRVRNDVLICNDPSISIACKAVLEKIYKEHPEYIPEKEEEDDDDEPEPAQKKEERSNDNVAKKGPTKANDPTPKVEESKMEEKRNDSNEDLLSLTNTAAFMNPVEPPVTRGPPPSASLLDNVASLEDYIFPTVIFVVLLAGFWKYLISPFADVFS